MFTRIMVVVTCVMLLVGNVAADERSDALKKVQEAKKKVAALRARAAATEVAARSSAYYQNINRVRKEVDADDSVERLALLAPGGPIIVEVSLTIDEQPFTWIADADARLGPVLEVIVNGRYYWAPFPQIRAIEITPPADLRDLVWLPAQLTWINGGETYGLIPVRYPGSEGEQDSAIQLARKTTWLELAENVNQGLGQRMLATDQDDYPLLDVRKITIT